MGLKTNLISVWEMDETSGTTVTDSHGSNDGTNYNCTVNQTGAPTNLDKCYYMNGTSAYIDCQDIFDFGDSQDFSIAFWINGTDNVLTNIPNIVNKRDLSAPNVGILCWYEYSTFNVDSSGAERDYSIVFGLDVGASVFNICTGKNSVPSTLSDWIHIVLYRSGTTIGIVLDAGTPNTYTNTGITADISSGSDFLIATMRLKNRFYGACKFDQVAGWDKALTSSEISEIYNSGDGLAYSSWDTGYSKTINGISSYSKINGVSVANIVEVNGV